MFTWCYVYFVLFIYGSKALTNTLLISLPSTSFGYDLGLLISLVLRIPYHNSDWLVALIELEGSMNAYVVPALVAWGCGGRVPEKIQNHSLSALSRYPV